MTVSPLTEASSSSLDEFFSRKPPYDAETLAAIKKEMRRLRERWIADGNEQAKPRAKKAPKATVTKVVSEDLFADTPEALP